ncbi:hypothetical protein Tco_1075823, partial [Tanacetum coccineum]
GGECLAENLVEEPKWGRSGGVQIESCRGCFYTTVTSDAYRMWNTLARIIKNATEEALGVVIGISKTHKTRRESWWLSEEVRSKLAVKQTRFKELLSCREGNQEDRLRVHERYKEAKRVKKSRSLRERKRIRRTIQNWTLKREQTISSGLQRPERRRRDLGDISFIKYERGSARSKDFLTGDGEKQARRSGSNPHRSLERSRGRGLECWPITKALANRVKVAELRMLRWTCGKTMLDMIPNRVYRAELEVSTIINKMKEGRLRWFEHVRRPQSAPVRRVDALVVDGLRRRDRPKLR